MAKTLTLPRIKFGKRKSRSVMARIRTDDGRIVVKEIPAAWGCMMDEDWELAWLIDGENQYFNQDLGCWVQPVSEKSCIPIPLRKVQTYADGQNDDRAEFKKLTDGICQIGFEDAQARQADKAKQNALIERISTIVSLICATVIIMGAMAYFQGC